MTGRVGEHVQRLLGSGPVQEHSGAEYLGPLPVPIQFGDAGDPEVVCICIGTS
ncbi:hypothetical protein GCM10023317_94690 [Actinopolymorpha pittospori]